MGFFNSLWDDLFGGGQSKAYRDLQNQIQHGMDARKAYTDQAIGYLSPYMSAGKGALGQYSNYLHQMGQLLNPSLFGGNGGPTADIPSSVHLPATGGASAAPGTGGWMSGYQESPYAKFQTQEALRAANQAAASSGMLGSGSNQEDNMKIAQHIASGDMQNYFHNLLDEQNLYQQGLSNLSGMGENAATQSGNWAWNTGAGLAGDYGDMGKAQANRDMANANGVNNALSWAMNLIKNHFAKGGNGQLPWIPPPE